MVFWLKKRWKDILFALIITAVLLFPYLSKDLLAIEHDTFFHVSRIEQLSLSIKEGNFFPAIYPYENNGFGYASPLFYSDVFLIVPALLHISGLPLTICYKFTVFIFSFISSFSMIVLVSKISKKRLCSWIAGCAYLFSNYRITDIYVRGALGEIIAFSFLPIILIGLYEIIEEDKDTCITLSLGITCLALSHNLTFLLGCILIVIISFISIPKLNKTKYKNLFLSTLFAFLITCFFTLPMLEQLSSQDFIVDYYAKNSDLQSGSMKLWQYFVNNTVFGYSGNTYSKDMSMTVNVGWFLTFAPMTYLLKKDKNRFVMISLVLGYICLVLPSALLPWDMLPFKVLQFPWRINTLTMLLLTLPASIGIYNACNKRIFSLLLIVVLCGECVYHVLPEYSRTFGLTSNMSWSDVLDGQLTDPYYSAYYVRVELAGGDYLPINSPDFRERSTNIKDSNGNDLDITYSKDYATITFTSNTNCELVMPLTYYKGYTVYEVKDGNKEIVECYSNSEAMVTFIANKNSEYSVTYEDTPLRKCCLWISCISLLGFIFYAFKKKRN